MSENRLFCPRTTAVSIWHPLRRTLHSTMDESDVRLHKFLFLNVAVVLGPWSQYPHPWPIVCGSLFWTSTGATLSLWLMKFKHLFYNRHQFWTNSGTALLREAFVNDVCDSVFHCRCVNICSLAFSMEGLYLSASSNTETVHIFKLETQKEKYVYVPFCLCQT